jgi:hypothetical protein
MVDVAVRDDDAAHAVQRPPVGHQRIEDLVDVARIPVSIRVSPPDHSHR